MTSHTLDRPVWNALSTRQADRAHGSHAARRMAPEYGVFAAAADRTPASLAALAALALPGTDIWLVEHDSFPLPAGMDVVSRDICLQMTLSRLSASGRDITAAPLADDDAPCMLELATLTRPGPFFARTHALGRFVGVRQDGVLIAMAGERMQPAGFTEISGVCTRPGHRGQGYAGALMRQVAAAFLARGETPFLHVYASNIGAIGLYRSLGFAARCEITMTVLRGRF